MDVWVASACCHWRSLEWTRRTDSNRCGSARFFHSLQMSAQRFSIRRMADSTGFSSGRSKRVCAWHALSFHPARSSIFVLAKGPLTRGPSVWVFSDAHRARASIAVSRQAGHGEFMVATKYAAADAAKGTRCRPAIAIYAATPDIDTESVVAALAAPTSAPLRRPRPRHVAGRVPVPVTSLAAPSPPPPAAAAPNIAACSAASLGRSFRTPE